MIKKLIYVVAVVVIFGGLLIGAITTHNNTQAKQTAQIQSVQSKLNQAITQVNTLESEVKANTTEATNTFNQDKATLCNYIETHVNTKTVALPSECN